MFRFRPGALLVVLLSLVAPPASSAQQVSVEEGTLRTGLETTPMPEADPPAFRVSWIRRDSGFRGSGIAIGDRIVAVNGAAVCFPRDNVKELVDAYEAALELLGDDQLQKLLDRTDLERKLE